MNEERCAEELAVHALRIGAIKVNPLQPFLWASGYYMPIYNDNRLFLGHEDAREHIIKRLVEKVSLSKSEVVAGTSTAGIPWASFVADRLKLPMIYVRDKPKEHGLKNQIEGIAADKTLEHKQVSLIEDLISTGRGPEDHQWLSRHYTSALVETVSTSSSSSRASRSEIILSASFGTIRDVHQILNPSPC
jgi:orotate phosphoribosyltransferase